MVECKLDKIILKETILTNANMSFSVFSSRKINNHLSFLKNILHSATGRFAILSFPLSFNSVSFINKSRNLSQCYEDFKQEFNTVKLKECKDLRGLNLYQVDGILPESSWLQARGCQTKSDCMQEASTITPCKQTSKQLEYNRFCLFKAKHQVQNLPTGTDEQLSLNAPGYTVS